MTSGLGVAMADLSLDNFQFFKFMFPGMYDKRLRLPDKFIRELGDRWHLRMKLARAGMPLWDVEVSANEKDGTVYLAGGWEEFARTHDLRDANLLIFHYDHGAATLIVTVFDPSTCCKQYVYASTAATGSASAQVVKCTVKRGSKSVTYHKDLKTGRWCSPSGINTSVPCHLTHQTANKKCGVKRGAKSVTGPVGSSAKAKGEEEERCSYTRSQPHRPTPIYCGMMKSRPSLEVDCLL